MSKKISFGLVIFLALFFLTPTKTQATELEEPVSGVDMVHFMMFVRWGNVLEEPTYRKKTVYDGSINLENSTSTSSAVGRVSLTRELLFEKHDENCDKILTKTPSISWQSCIYNHLDGVKVLVSGQASDTLTIHTAQGDLAKTVKEFYETRTPIIQKLANNQEIVVKIFPVRKKSYFLTIFWGGGKTTQKVDFSGSLKIESGATKSKLMKALRFEEKQGDNIASQTEKEITWNSYILGGQDGVLMKVALDKEAAAVKDAALTINFSSPEVNWQKSFNLIDLYHQKIVKETIEVTGVTYNLVLAVTSQPNRKLVKVKNKTTVYMIEDETKRPIPSPDVLKENNLSFSNIETISEEELESYAQGENLTYPDGTLIKGSGPGVYLISEGKKRPIKSAKALIRLGYQWKNIKKIADKELSSLEDGSSITENSDLPEGSLVQETGKKEIYLIEGGRKKLVSSDILKARGYKSSQIMKVKEDLLEKFESAENLIYPDGTLVKGSGPGVYLIDQGKKRPIKSLETFKSLKFNFKEVKKIKDDELKNLAEDKEMVGE